MDSALSPSFQSQGSGPPWRPSGLVTLLTDFGIRDPYVGVMKGVMHRHNPDVVPIDLSHEVPPQDLRLAAWHLRSTWRYFPVGTVHLVVVDPGVGSGRCILVARDRGHAFVAPDNGVLGPVLSESACVFALDVERFALSGAGNTFHGRDIFAPAVAAIAGGLEPEQAGASVEAWQTIDWPRVEHDGAGALATEVLYADRFGNLITTLAASEVEAGSWCIEVADHELPLVRTYADVSPGEGLALIGSCGTLEVSVRDGNAAARFSVGAGTKVRVRRRD